MQCVVLDPVSIPDRVLGFFRRYSLKTFALPTFVSIPDRVLGFFRLTMLASEQPL